MLGTRTKQVNSYGRRGSRIVSVSDRPDRESANSSEAASDIDAGPPRPLKRHNSIIISPAKPLPGLHRLKGPIRPPRSSLLAQNKNTQSQTMRHAVKKRMQSKPDSDTPVRPPLTPLRRNAASKDLLPSVKGKPITSGTKSTRTSLKPYAPVIAVDILLFDETGNMLTQERRLSHPDIQANQVRTAAGKGKKIPKTSLPSPPPIVISDDSDLNEISPKPVFRRRNRKHHVIVISSDESEAEDDSTAHRNPFVHPRTRSKSLREEVAIPPAPSQKNRVTFNPPSPTSLFLTPRKLPASAVSSFRVGTAAILAPPVPTAKPRQLTPIRGSSSRTFRPPPTPSTPTEADLSLDFSQLDLSDATEIDDLATIQPKYLVPLLNECAQTSPYEFSAFIETFPFDPVVLSSGEDEDVKFRKIGEASYSEVFGIGDVVLKIIPIRTEEESFLPETGEMPAPSDARDVLKEIIVTREIGEICDKFVKLLKTYVVRGKYPSLLLDLWDEYNKRKGSESIRPDSFGLTQVYAIIILPNGGPDLESFTFKNALKFGWHQACGIFWQVARALEQAERLVHFEHRDLHWGQILVKNISVKKPTRGCLPSLVAMDDTRFGIKITIIDLGLSRMSAADSQGTMDYWTPFDDEIFEGEGDYQYDIYRMMKGLIGSTWRSYHPFTNVMWLHYLVTKLLRGKRLKPPGGKKQSGGDTRALPPTGYNEQECYDCLEEMEVLLGKCIASARRGQKIRRKTAAASDGPKSAGDVIAYGVQHGWVR